MRKVLKKIACVVTFIALITSFVRKPTKQATLVFGLVNGWKLSVIVDRDIKELYLPDRRIVTIPENICELTNLTKLYLWGNQIVDVKPLAKMTSLTLLDLGDNQIVDVKPLTKLTSLTELILWDNPIPSDQTEQLKRALPNTKVYT
jgi:Leucine-rich repeat (LRR) protein